MSTTTEQQTMTAALAVASEIVQDLELADLYVRSAWVIRGKEYDYTSLDISVSDPRRAASVINMMTDPIISPILDRDEPGNPLPRLHGIARGFHVTISGSGTYGIVDSDTSEVLMRCDTFKAAQQVVAITTDRHVHIAAVTR